MIAVMKRLTLFSEKSNDPGRGRKGGRGMGAHWARCGLALDGAKIERGFITCIFRRSALGGRGYKIKKGESKCTSFIRIYITAGSGFFVCG